MPILRRQYASWCGFISREPFSRPGGGWLGACSAACAVTGRRAGRVLEGNHPLVYFPNLDLRRLWPNQSSFFWQSIHAQWTNTAELPATPPPLFLSPAT